MKVSADAWKIVDDDMNETGVVRLSVNTDCLKSAASNFVDVEDLDNGDILNIYDTSNVSIERVNPKIVSKRIVEETNEVVKSIECDMLLEFDASLTWDETIGDDFSLKHGIARVKMNIEAFADFSNQQKCTDVIWVIQSPVIANLVNESRQFKFSGESMVALVSSAVKLEIIT